MSNKRKSAKEKKALHPLQPKMTQLLQNALQYYQTGHLSAAIQLYQQVLAIDNKNSDALNLLGISLAQLQKSDEAEQLLRKAIKINKKVADYHYNLGIILSGQNKQAEAISCFQSALKLKSDHVQARLNLGNLFNKQEKFAEAIDCYQNILQLNPQYIEAYNNLGTIFFKQEKLEQAYDYYQKALALAPNFADTYNNLGLLLNKQEKFNDALACYQRAIELNPNFTEAYFNAGNLLATKEKYSEAITYIRHSLSLKTDYIQAHNILASLLHKTGKIHEALAHYKKSLALDPTQWKMHTNLIFASNDAVDQTRALLFNELQLFNQQHAEPLAIHIQPHTNMRDPDKKLKIGYVSADFRQHAVAYFAESILKNHNHTHFNIFCYYNYEQQDNFTNRFKNYADHWHDCFTLSDEELTEQIRQDEIDILIDLSGHTAGNRLLVFARKPAPIQATYVGFPNSTGLTAIDYHITDNYFDPIDIGEKYHSEQLIRMPHSYHCYTPNEDSPEWVELPAIKNDYITFCSFNKFDKLNDELVNLWVKILKLVPNSRFIIKNHLLENETLQKEFAATFEQQGIENHRLILGSEPSTLATLHAYNQADIALDSFPYNGCTTTCQALWMGVPVVTLVGETHVARAGLSLLTAAGFPEFIADTKEQYIEIAVKLANNIADLQSLRQKMRERLKSSPLMDGLSFTQHLETHYRQMWQRWCHYKNL